MLDYWSVFSSPILDDSKNPLKFNIAPKNRQSPKEPHLPTILFQGRAEAMPVRKKLPQKTGDLRWIHRDGKTPKMDGENFMEKPII